MRSRCGVAPAVLSAAGSHLCVPDIEIRGLEVPAGVRNDAK